MNNEAVRQLEAEFVALVRDNDLLTENIIGFAIDVHRQLGPGLLEFAYGRMLVLRAEAGWPRISTTNLVAGCL